MDPVDLIEEAHPGRLERLVPVRVGRMVTSPYAFLRGAASLMPADRAFARFARAYADQTEADHQALQRAVKSGRLPAEHGV